MSFPPLPPNPKILLYQTDAGRTRVECRFEQETIPLSQALMAELFRNSIPNINLHLRAIHEERELSEQATIKRYLIVREAYLEFAELQARNRKPMYMADWIAKLDDFLRLSDREILNHAGQVSHETAQLKADAEFAKYRAFIDALPQPVDKDFDEAVEKLRQTRPQKRKPKPKDQ